MPKPNGAPIVLTADRTLMAHYDVLLDGMMAASQTTTTPWFVMDRLLLPRAPHWDGRAQVAPLGLRRIEAALLADGFEPDDIVVADDAHLDDAIGPATRLVAISSGEPSGLGMSSTTMAGVMGGEIYPQVMFRRLLEGTKRLIAARAPDAKLILGGPGAWQIADQPHAAPNLGLDHIVVGYAEGNAPEVFAALLDGRDLPEVIEGQGVPGAAIPPIRGATTMGVVEVGRGCGLGCDFCAVAGTPMAHLPIETILADAVTNISGGMNNVSLLSEDLFRYGGHGMYCKPDAILDLLERLRSLGGLRHLQAVAANIASIMQYTDAELAGVRELLVGNTRSRHPWVNVGIETASGQLLRANGGGPKMADAPPDEWGNACAEQLRRLCRAGFTPMASLVVGLPGETADDVARTLWWVRSLHDAALMVFPVVYAPIGGDEPSIAKDLTRLQWQLISASYELNFKWLPRVYSDNQAAGQAALGRRLLYRALSGIQVALWRRALRHHTRRAAQ